MKEHAAREIITAAVEPEAEPLFLTVPAFARLVRKSASAIYADCLAGRVPSVKIGGARRIPLSVLRQFEQAALGMK